jgi:LEA14-like dessication related protein
MAHPLVYTILPRLSTPCGDKFCPERTGGRGTVRPPLETQGKLPVPAGPEVRVAQVKWDQLTLDHADGRVRLNIVNRNRFPLELARLAYALSLGDVEAGRSVIEKPAAFEPDSGAATVEIPIASSPKKFGLAAFRMLTGAGEGKAQSQPRAMARR